MPYELRCSLSACKQGSAVFGMLPALDLVTLLTAIDLQTLHCTACSHHDCCLHR